jgi:hypothetical protein
VRSGKSCPQTAGCGRSDELSDDEVLPPERALQDLPDMRARVIWIWACLVAACGPGSSELDGPDASPGPGSGSDGMPPEGTPDAAVQGDPHPLNIGWNNGYAAQFDYFGDFFDHAVYAGPKLCHAYVSWDVATKPVGEGTIEDHASPAFIEDWLRNAQGRCDEALISFKAMTPGAVPATATFANAVEAFASTNWKARTGFTGKLAITPWNEPNNAADSGNGLGIIIPPRVAARYYLATERACQMYGCTAIAGDFASNGTMWNDYEMNCANDDVAPANLCAQKSPMNTTNKAASYLDVYKNEIVDRATEFGLPATFRPMYFAYHGWHDSNSYLNTSDHCSTYATCTLRRVLYSLGGTWANVEIHNSEDGVGQTAAPDDRMQACAAAFQLRLMAISPRVKRLYITRLRGGPGTLILDNGTPRPALKIFQDRLTTYQGGNCP